MPSGEKPKGCYARPESAFWWFDFQIQGERYRGSTGCQESSRAAAFVEALKKIVREEGHDSAKAVLDPTYEPIKIKSGRKQITLADAIDKWEREEGFDKDTFKQLQAQGEWLCNIGGDKLLSDITHEDVKQYYLRRTKMVTRLGKPLARSSANREISHLRLVYRHCEAAGYDVGVKPVWKRIMDASAEVERIRELSAAEWDRLSTELEKINPYLLSVVEFAMLAGLRKTAVIDLVWDRVDFENLELRAFLKTKGKNKRTVTVPLTQRLLEIINDQPRVEGVDQVFTYEPKRRPNSKKPPKKRRRFSSCGWGKDWREALKKANVKDFRFHDLRHTAATRIVRKSGNLKIAQQLLGHRNISTTARYAHAFTDDIRAAMEKVDEAYLTPRPTPAKLPSNVIPLRRAG